MSDERLRGAAACGAVLLVAALWACSGEHTNPVVPDPKAPIVAPTVVPSAEPPPTPTPAPEPTRSPRANRPPVVTLSFPGPSSCHPHPQPCSVPVRADASDPDGDAITYAWSGCTFGRDSLADCRVTGPSTFEAIVEVTDARGATARDSVTIRGINLPPDDVFGTTAPSQASGALVILLGNVRDPEDGGICGREFCLDASASGPCGPNVFLDCTCLGGAYAEVRAGTGPGTCAVSVRVRDRQGAVATLVTRFEVRAP